MLAITSVYHRLLTHRSYQAPSWVLWVGSIIASGAGQMGPSWWKAHHIHHHQYTDLKPDTHSPYRFLPNLSHDKGNHESSPVISEGAQQKSHAIPSLKNWFQVLRGFCWSHYGWLLSSRFFPVKLPNDVERDWVLKSIDRLHFLPLLALGAVSYGIGGIEYLGAFFLSTTLLFHGVQTVNSLSHMFGAQPFLTDDHSRNNGFVALLTLGEGWHNLHHAFQSSCRQGITVRAGQVSYLLDPTFSFIKLLASLKLASKLRVPTEGELLARANQPSIQHQEYSAILQPLVDS
jgi:stearoyl-CoA desaturase (delta-9 desaturase)